MKNVMTTLSSLVVYATVVAPAFAAGEGMTTINPCPTGADSTFSTLCKTDKLNNPQHYIQVIVGILLLSAVLIALFFLIIGGIRWILSGGDKGKVDSARGTIVGAIVGLVIALAAFFILSLVARVFGLGDSIFSLTIPNF